VVALLPAREASADRLVHFWPYTVRSVTVECWSEFVDTWKSSGFNWNDVTAVVLVKSEYGAHGSGRRIVVSGGSARATGLNGSVPASGIAISRKRS
jgi:hypothetical protein